MSTKTQGNQRNLKCQRKARLKKGTALGLVFSLLGGGIASAAIEEIVITAQRREESLQSVPIAVSAFSGDILEDAGILDIQEITAMTPGFSMSTYNPVTPQPYIRGVGTNSSSVGDDTSVGIFVDDVYMGRAGGYLADFYDVQRVEVLRGPQGTLYGRNVAGGAINVITKNPTDEFEGNMQASYGSFSLSDIKGALSGPIGSSVGYRVAFTSRQRDGHTDNIVTGNELRDEDKKAIRGKLSIDPSDNVSMLISLDYSKLESVGGAARGVVTSAFAYPTANVQEDVSLIEDGWADREVFGTSVKMDIDTRLGTLTWIAAYRENDYSFVDDLIGTFGPDIFGLPLINEGIEKSKQFSNELRLSNDQDEWAYTVGLYYLQEDVDRFETFDSSPVGLPGFSRPEWFGFNETTSYALFGEVTWRATDRFALTAGGRYTKDEKDFFTDAVGPDLFGFLSEAYSVQVSNDWSEFTPKVTAQFQVTEDAMVYATWSTGYKAGGNNGLAPTEAGALASFEPEHLTNYEAGLKADFFDNRLRANVAVFWQEYEDQQDFIFDPLTGVSTNGKDSEISGAEVEFFFSPTEGFDAWLTYARLDTEVTKNPSNPALVGNTLMRSPENSFSAGAQYSWPVNGGELMVRADFSHQDEVFFDVENTPNSGDDGYSLVNLRGEFSADSGWALSIWAKNVADEEYYVHAFDFTPSFGFPIYGDPRTIGATISVNF